MFKLGDKVKFNKRILKASNYADFNCLTPDQTKELNENEFIAISAIKEELMPDKLVGIIVGKRMIVEIRYVEESEFGDNPTGSLMDSKYVQVYLVATRMDFFYKVRPEWLEIVNS